VKNINLHQNGVPFGDIYVINDGGPYNGLNFFTLNNESSGITNINVTDKNSQFTSESIFRSDRGEMFYHYSNDDILAVKPGLFGRSVYGQGVRLSGGDCDVMFALIKVVGDKNTVLWDSTPKKLNSTPRTFIQTFTTTSFYNSADQPASNYGGTKYYLGWVRSNIGSYQYESFIQFVNGFDFSISQSQYGLDNKGDTSLILQSSFPAGFQNSDCDVLQGNAVMQIDLVLYIMMWIMLQANI
jgi:hypothetical protein